MLTLLLTVVAGASLAGVAVLDRRAPSRRVEALALVAPLALFWAFNHGALASWWMSDDPCLLRSVYEHGLLAHFYDPAVWRPLSGTLLMPWSLFSLGLDSRIFGLDPAAFYAHQLLSFSLLLVLTYGFARGFLGATGGTVAASLLAVSPASFAVAQQLMNRHYLEGLIFALAGLWLFRGSVCRGPGPRVPGPRWPAMTGAALCYLLAATAKEIYVPLVAVPFLMPVGDFRRRLRCAWPWLGVAAAYVPWRITMLGPLHSFASAVYGSETESFEVADLLRGPRLLGLRGDWLPWLAVAGLLGLGVFLIRDVKPARGLTAGLAAVVALPLVPVASKLELRHLLAPVLLAALGAAFVLDRLDAAAGRRRLAARVAGLALVAAATATLALSPYRLRHETTVGELRREGELILSSAGDGILLTRVPLPFYLGCLSDLRRLALGLPPGPGFCPAPCLARQLAPGRPVWRLDRGEPAGRFSEVTEDPGPCDRSRPLTVSFDHSAGTGTLRWRLGPWTEGDYRASIVFSTDPPGISAPIRLPPEGSLPWTLDRPLSWIVSYRSPDGWETWSPVLTLESGGKTGLRRP